MELGLRPRVEGKPEKIQVTKGLIQRAKNDKKWRTAISSACIWKRQITSSDLFDCPPIWKSRYFEEWREDSDRAGVQIRGRKTSHEDACAIGSLTLKLLEAYDNVTTPTEQICHSSNVSDQCSVVPSLAHASESHSSSSTIYMESIVLKHMREIDNLFPRCLKWIYCDQTSSRASPRNISLNVKCFNMSLIKNLRLLSENQTQQKLIVQTMAI